MAKELTLKDRLSRLTFTQARKLLWSEGNKLIMQGGRFEIDSIAERVYILAYNLIGTGEKKNQHTEAA